MAALRAGGQVQSVVATMEAIEQSSRKISDIISDRYSPTLGSSSREITYGRVVV